MKKWLSGLLILLLMTAAFLMGCAGGTQERPQPAPAETAAVTEAAETDVQTESEAPGPDQDSDEQTESAQMPETESADARAAVIEENGAYTSKEDVALYLYTYGHLPDNFITKKEAQALGWDNKKGNLQDVAPGMSIGGDRFGNYEGLLPEANKRKYFECDIDYEGGYRGAKRIIYSNDGLIFYTEDHYKSFEQLYGE